VILAKIRLKIETFGVMIALETRLKCLSFYVYVCVCVVFERRGVVYTQDYFIRLCIKFFVVSVWILASKVECTREFQGSDSRRLRTCIMCDRWRWSIGTNISEEPVACVIGKKVTRESAVFSEIWYLFTKSMTSVQKMLGLTGLSFHSHDETEQWFPSVSSN
jgi:hypothetical protein